jgi:hypothetical protein
VSPGVSCSSSCTVLSPVVIGGGRLGRPTGTVSPEKIGAFTLSAHRPSAPVSLSRWRRRFDHLPHWQPRWWSGCSVCHL